MKESDDDGLQNDIVIVNDSDVFRFSKTEDSKVFLDHEFKVLNIVRKYVDISVPEFKYIESGVVRYKCLHGTPLFRNEILRMEEKLQDNLAKQIGVFLRQLHSIPMKVITENGIKGFPGNGTREDYIAQFNIIQDKLFPYIKSYTKEYIIQIYKPLVENENFLCYEPALIHGDLAPYHFFYSKELNKVNGVIDFGVSGCGDPAHDVSVILDNFGEEFTKRISKYYPELRTFIDRSRFYAMVSSLWWALRGLESNDISWHLLHLHTARNIMPIGIKL